MTGFAGIYELASTGTGQFRGAPAVEGGARVYGGHTLTQALLACFHGVAEGWDCYSLQAQFIRIGKPGLPIDYAVEQTSDSRNFAVRRVRADQGGRAVMTMTVSFQAPFAGADIQVATMPDVVGPEDLVSEAERYRRIVERMGGDADSVQHLPSGIDARWTEPQDLEHPTARPPYNRTWLRVTEAVGPTPRDRQLALAYCSDFALLETALRPQGYSWGNPPNLLVGTLDHAVWFHRGADVSQWHLCASNCSSIHGGRGFVRAELFAPGGGLVASLAQEGVLRLI